MTSEQTQTCARFIEPEKLADLRTKPEIELMYGGRGHGDYHFIQYPWAGEIPRINFNKITKVRVQKLIDKGK